MARLSSRRAVAEPDLPLELEMAFDRACRRSAESRLIYYPLHSDVTAWLLGIPGCAKFLEM